MNTKKNEKFDCMKEVHLLLSSKNASLIILNKIEKAFKTIEFFFLLPTIFYNYD